MERQRELRFKGQLALVEELSKDGPLSATQKRRIAIQRVVGFCQALMAAAIADPWYRAKATATTDEYQHMLEKSLEHPGWVPSTDGAVLTAPDLGYLTEMAAGLCISFLCRHCGFYGLSSQWIKHSRKDLHHTMLLFAVHFDIVV